MNYCIAKVSAAPIRSENSDKSEMVNQLLIGEAAEIISEDGLWVNIKKVRDQYSGWVNRNELFIPQSQDEVDRLDSFLKNSSTYAQSILFVGEEKDPNNRIALIPGCNVQQKTNEKETLYLFPFGAFKSSTITPSFKKNDLLETALQFLGTPYLWGGLSTFGIDCSGFTQTTALLHGIHIERDASKQALKSIAIEQRQVINSVQAGNLIFFNPGPKKNISHVGFYLEDGLLLHASGQVKINALLPESASNTIPYDQRYGESICAYLPLNTPN